MAIPTGITELCGLCEQGIAVEHFEGRVVPAVTGTYKRLRLFFQCSACESTYCNSRQMGLNNSEYGYYTYVLDQGNDTE